jgi:hypothetical protein
MVEVSIPPDQRDDFAFHATEIYSGKKRFDKERWPRELRWKILDELVSIPQKLDLPIVMGFVPKGKLRRGYEGTTQADIDLGSHAIAFTIAMVAAQEYMVRGAGPGEVARIMIEDSDHAKVLIKTQREVARNPKLLDQLDDDTRKHFPLDRIVDDIVFAKKASAPLQVADAVAFAIMRRLRRGNASERFYDPLEPLIIRRPNLARLDKLVAGGWDDTLDAEAAKALA